MLWYWDSFKLWEGCWESRYVLKKLNHFVKRHKQDSYVEQRNIRGKNFCPALYCKAWIISLRCCAIPTHRQRHYLACQFTALPFSIGRILHCITPWQESITAPAASQFRQWPGIQLSPRSITLLNVQLLAAARGRGKLRCECEWSH